MKLYKEKHNLSEEELLKFKYGYNDKKVEAIVERAVDYDLLPVIKYFIENGGNPYFVTTYFSKRLNILNIAAERGCLDIINYLLEKIFLL
ncbi:MAG: hypothetical protein O7D30_03735 [Rickettsia endosymbiont of Ixodes persulcatus]|nr:hypothetical protein [Rickettsia endosymbiont of Ixodes persulcatus]